MTLRRLYQLPDIPTGHPIPGRGWFSIITPVERTNLITNPSCETGAGGYSAAGGGALSRVTGTSVYGTVPASYHGAYSISTTPATSTGGLFYLTSTLTSGTTYVASCKFLGTPGVNYKLSVATTGAVDLATYHFTATGRWQWVWVFYKETSSTTRRIYVTADSDARATVNALYVDGLQLEACGTEGVFPTTYIDGDQTGLLANQFPYPYYWTGTPHASTSVRLATTRAWGRVVNLDMFRYRILGWAGLALTAVTNIAALPAASDGALYQGTLASPRQFVVSGYFDAPRVGTLQRSQSSLYDAIGPDSVTPRQPCVLSYQAYDCSRAISTDARIIAAYQAGLEGIFDSPFFEKAPITFQAYLPTIRGGEAGASLNVQTTVTNANAIVRRSAAGVWSALGTGLSGVGVTALAIAPHPDGTIYVGGVFTDAGGSGADYAAIYTPSTDTWSVIKAATTFNAQVNAIAIAANGDVYFGGLFTNADGIAAADGIVKYTPSTNTFTALGTGVNANGVYSLAFDQSGNLYAGGSYTLMGGVANTVRIAKWDGSAWSAMGTGASTNIVRSLLVVGTNVYAGGDYGLMGGVANTVGLARWDGTAWNALGTGVAGGAVLALANVSGMLYIGGLFTTINGQALPFLAKWNGTGFSDVGGASALSSYVQAFAKSPTGVLFLGGDAATWNGVTFPDRVAIWNGGNFTPLDIDLPGSATIFSLALVNGNNDLYIGYNTTGSGVAAGTTTVTNTGSAYAYPTIVIKGPTSGTSRLYQVANESTGAAILLNLQINAGETVTIRTSSAGITIASDFTGDLAGSILPGNSVTLSLRPGTNTVSFFAAGSTVTATIQWIIQYQSLADLTE